MSDRFIAASATFFGWFCMSMVCLAVAVFAICVLVWVWDRAVERFEHAAATRTRLALGRSIRASSHWFSEAPDVRFAIEVLGNRVIDGMGVDADEWRREWQSKRVLSPTVSHNDK